MKIGVTQIILPYGVNETLSLCRDAGYEAVELVFTEDGDPSIDMGQNELEQLAQTFAAANIEIGSILGRYAERGNLLSLSAKEREPAQRALERILAIAGMLNVNCILLHPGQLSPEGTYQQAWDILAGILREMAATAQHHQVAIGLENVWNKFLLSPREMRQFVDEIASPWVGTYLDTANMMAYGYPEHWIRELKDRIKRVHFKDFQRKQHRFVPLMEGDTDWKAIMQALREIGYDGCVIHEVSGDREQQIEMAKRMRTILAG